MLPFFKAIGKSLRLRPRRLDARTTCRRPRLRLEVLEDRLVPSVSITNFPVSGYSLYPDEAIAGGPGDGAIVTDWRGIGFMTFQGGYSYITSNPAPVVVSRVVYDQGNVWALEWAGQQAYIARYGQGSNYYPIPGEPYDIAVDSKGNLWLTESHPGAIVKIDPNNPSVPVSYEVPGSGVGVGAITVGEDGGIWFTAGAASGNFVGRLDPQTHRWEAQSTGAYYANAITATPTGVGFVLGDLTHHDIGVLNYDMSGFQEHKVPGLPNLKIQGITYGPDGNLWFTEAFGAVDTQEAGRIGWASSLTGEYEGELPTPGAQSQPVSITRGWTQWFFNENVTTNTLWYTDGGGYIGRIDFSQYIVGPVKFPWIHPNFPLGLTYFGGVPGNGIGELPFGTDNVAPTIVAEEILYAGRGQHKHVVGFQLNFNKALDPARAQDLANYAVSQTIRRRGQGQGVMKAVGLASAVYGDKTDTVTLILAGHAAFGGGGQIVLNASSPGGIADTQGKYLDGTGKGVPGGNANLVIAPKARTMAPKSQSIAPAS
jgi:hypothetical protein